MKKINFREKRTRILGFACLTLAVASCISSCKEYDLDKRTPEWLGTSIYETLEEGFVSEDGKDYTGKFTTFVRLIDDLNYTNVLAKTGSKTLFVADDDAFQRFYAKGIFKKADGSNVSCYEDLSLAQKKMLMNGAMLNNVYQVAMLSSSQGPTLGDCMRRISSISIYDSVPVMTKNQMPDTKHWKYYRNQDHGFAVLQDGTNKPMVMFVNKFLTAKKITDDDYDFLFNQGAYNPAKKGRAPKDASVNGIRIETQNKKCFNGFIHVMEDVIYSLPNMAEYIATTDKSKVYSSIMDRFCAPYYSETHTQEIKRLKTIGSLNLPDDVIDSVFQKQYFSQRSQGNNSISQTPDRQVIAKDNLLKFDPGWNTYYSSTSSTTTADVALQQNMGVMLVPEDQVLLDWWVNGGGKALKQRYGRLAGNPANIEEFIYDLDSVPDNVIIKLLNNNMLNSLVGSVPSKFKNVLNDANDPMGIEPQNVNDVEMCCNGAVFFTNVVFSPTAYRSVSYPVLVNEKLKIINWAINQLEFDAYLNSMVATYSFFVPQVSDNGITDPADPAYEKLHDKMIYIDPVSYGQAYLNDGMLKAYAFEYDERQKTVQARIYPYDPKTGTIDVSGTGSTATSAQINDRLEDILDYHVIIGDVEEVDPATGSTFNYFQTKGRGTIYFDWNPADKTVPEGTPLSSKVKGSYQVETERIDTIADNVITIQTRYDQSKNSATNGNGRTYVIDKPLLTARLSIYDILSDEVNYPEFHEFFELMSHAGINNVGLFSQNMNKHATGSMNLTTLNTYHYTLYVPTEKALKDLYKSGRLFTIEMIDSIKTTYDDNIDFIGEWKAEDWPNLANKNVTSYNKIMSMFDNYVSFIKFTSDSIPSDILNTPMAKDSVFYTTPWFNKYTAKLEKQITDFVKYHIQDNSVYVNGKFTIDLRENPLGEANYETAYMNDNSQFVKLSVKYDHARNKIFILDTETDKALRADAAYVAASTEDKIQMREARAKVVDPATAVSKSGKPLYNIMCREYEYNNASVGSATEIETSSYVVIHLIDGTLNNGDF